jgi:hypothetical protein
MYQRYEKTRAYLTSGFGQWRRLRLLLVVAEMARGSNPLIRGRLFPDHKVLCWRRGRLARRAARTKPPKRSSFGNNVERFGARRQSETELRQVATRGSLTAVDVGIEFHPVVEIRVTFLSVDAGI